MLSHASPWLVEAAAHTEKQLQETQQLIVVEAEQGEASIARAVEVAPPPHSPRCYCHHALPNNNAHLAPIPCCCYCLSLLLLPFLLQQNFKTLQSNVQSYNRKLLGEISNAV